MKISEYLKTTYRPDRDLVDGRIEERNAGEHDHAALQAALILWFGQHQQEWNIEVLPEQRIQISPTRFRVPDVCVVSLDQPVEQILTRPPLVCIEILSPEDTMRRMQERIDDYRKMSVENIWLFDSGNPARLRLQPLRLAGDDAIRSPEYPDPAQHHGYLCAYQAAIGTKPASPTLSTPHHFCIGD